LARDHRRAAAYLGSDAHVASARRTTGEAPGAEGDAPRAMTTESDLRRQRVKSDRTECVLRKQRQGYSNRFERVIEEALRRCCPRPGRVLLVAGGSGVAPLPWPVRRAHATGTVHPSLSQADEDRESRVVIQLARAEQLRSGACEVSSVSPRCGKSRARRGSFPASPHSRCRRQTRWRRRVFGGPRDQPVVVGRGT
jgi:hypothetical protein